jgi:DNA topoisomerase VI subunit B
LYNAFFEYYQHPCIDILLPEYDREAITFRQVLKRIPDEASSWTPHEIAMNLGSLATHVAMMSTWTSGVMTQNAFDISASTNGSLTINFGVSPRK